MPNEYKDTIRFTLSEIIRISKIDKKEMFKGKHRLEWFATLPSPSGFGAILCGYEAYKRLGHACGLAVARSDHAGRLDPEDVFQALKPLITQRFLKEERGADEKECAKAFSAAVRAAAKDMVQLTYYVPVHLGPVRSPDEFSIGPVKFSLMTAHIESLTEQEKIYLNDSVGDVEVKQTLLDDTKKYYSEFGWVAEVCVEKSSPSLSRTIANRRVQHAVDCLHLYLGTQHSDHIRASGPTLFTDRRAEIVKDSHGKIDVSTSAAWLSNSLPDEWWEWVNAEGGDQLNSLFGEAITNGSDLSSPAQLAQRVLDALLWFGQAARDEFQASRIVKYVTAIERILVTEGSKENLVDTLSKRGAALTFAPEEDDLDELEQRFKKVYDLRSELVHGSRSPSDEKMGKGENEAEDLARRVLYRSVQYFGTEGLAKAAYSDNKLKKSYEDLRDWAETASKNIEVVNTDQRH